LNTQTTNVPTSALNTTVISSSISDISSNLAKGLFTWGSNIGDMSSTNSHNNANLTTPTKSSSNDFKVVGVPASGNTNLVSTNTDTHLSNEDIIKQIKEERDRWGES
jgi:hypothetical protein